MKIVISPERSGDLLECSSPECGMRFMVFAFSEWTDDHTGELNQAVTPQCTDICPYCGRESQLVERLNSNG